MNTVDYVIVGVLVISMGLGWVRGFLKTVLKPVCWVLCVYLGYAYYMRTHSLVVSLLIGLLGPFAVRFLLTTLIEIIQKSGKKDDEKKKLSLLNRGLGLLVSSVWTACWIVLVFFMVGMFPFKVPGFEPLRRPIVESRSYGIFSQIAGSRSPRLTQTRQASLDFTNPETIQQLDIESLRKSKEFENLMDHPQVKSLFEDETFQDRIRNGEVIGIMEDPRMREILQDPAVMKDFISFYNRLTQIAPSEVSPEEVFGQSGDGQ